MRDNLENNSVVQNSGDFNRSPESVNGEKLHLEQYNYRVQQQKLHKKIEDKERLKADLDLDKFINTHYPGNDEALDLAKEHFIMQEVSGIHIGEKELKKYIDEKLIENKELSNEDRIKNYKEELTKQGKSQTEILSLLISKFENVETVSVWVENWRNFQKLHNFAESKPPVERQVIQNIISKADFTSESAFSTSLAEISQSAEISTETKLEISREFGGSHIDSVDGMDYQLQQVKEHTKAIEKKISIKSHEKSFLNLEIENLEDEIENLPLDDPKRQELEAKIEQKKEILEQTESEIDRLEKGKPKDLSFKLRKGFSAKLNSDGSRSIRIDNENFAIKLPSNKWLFSDKKNMRSINLVFPYIALKNQNIADSLFRPNLENNGIPSIENRKMGHLILNSLGFDDTKILSEENIKQLKKDLSFLTPKNGKTGQENLIELEVFDVASQSVDNGKLKKVLEFVRKNRG